MSPESLLQQFGAVADAPGGVQELRELILQLAVRGKLVPQDPGDEPASVLLERIETEKERLYEAGKFRRPKKLPPIEAEEVPFGVPEGWSCVRLAQLGTWAVGNGFPTRYQGHEDKPLLFCKVSDMNLPGNERLIRTTQNTIDHEIADKIRATIHPPGTVIFPKIGGAIATNKRRILQRPSAIDNNCLGLIPNAACSSEWLFLQLSAIDFTVYQSGTSVPALSQGTLSQIPVGLPPLAEQCRIVAKVDQLMSLCDELEERQRRRAEKRLSLNKSALHHLATATERAELYDHWRRIREHFDLLYEVPETVAELRQAVLQLAVRGKLVPQDPNDEPARVLLKRIEAEQERLYREGGIEKPKKLPPIEADDVPFEVPEGWEWVHFGQVMLDIEAGWSPQCEPYARHGDAWGVLKISSISWGKFNPQENKALPSNLTPRPEYEVWPGDFLMSRANTAGLVGRSVIVGDTPPGLLLNDKTLRVLLPDSVDRRYLNLFNNSKIAREYYAASASGTSSSMRNLSRNQIQLLAVSLPPLAEQLRIVERVDRLMALCDELEAKLTAARAKAEHLASAVVHHVSAT